VQQRRLSRAVRADDGQDLALAHVDAHARHGLDAAKGLGYVADLELTAHGLSWPGPNLMVTERPAHDSRRARARPWDGRSRIARGACSTQFTTWNRAHRRRFRRVAPAPQSIARSRRWRE